MEINNNMNSPQFGAAKFDKGARKYMAKLGEKGKIAFANAKEALENSKYFDLIIDGHGPRVQSKSGDLSLRGFSPESRPIAGDLWIRCLDDADIASVAPERLEASNFALFYDDEAQAKKVYDQMYEYTRKGDEIGKTALVVGELEKYYAKGLNIVV